MNLVDYIIIGIMALSILIAFYRGFVSSVLSMGGGLISFGLSFVLYPKLSALIQGNQELVRTLLHYTDASNRIGDLELAITNVGQMTQDKIAQVLEKVSLPPPFDAMLQSNLMGRSFTGAGLENVSDYVSQTILHACINIICFILCFVVIWILWSILCNAIRAVFRFPILKQLDWLAGGAFGFLRGILICYAVFALVPLILTVVPIDMVQEMIDASQLAPLFNNGNLILSIINGKLF